LSAKRKLLKRQNLRNNEYYDFQKVVDGLYEDSCRNRKFYHLVEIIQRCENILLAYRNIKNNDGSHTPGVDGRTIKYLARLTTEEIISLVQRKLANYYPQRVRRVIIPKPNGKTRPLGIPTIVDRLVQQCILQVLDPICEAKFHKHSYGFRSLRSTKHAIARAYHLAQKNNLHYVVDVDIKGFFDNIDHGKLLKQLWTLGIHDKSLIKIISRMLKAEIDGEGVPTCGTPQGGILSPLLANVVLNELDWWISDQWETKRTKHTYAVRKNSNYAMYQSLKNFSNLKEIYIVRYADDFKIFCRNHNQAEKIFHGVKDWLKERLGLEISQEKSQITNLRKSYSDFLGVKMMLTRKGKKYTADNRVRSDYVIKSRVADKAVKAIMAKVRHHSKEIQCQKRMSGAALTSRFNAYLLGVHNYYNCATNCILDFERIAYRSRAVLKNRLNPRRRKDGDKLPSYIATLYGKSKQIRFVHDIPLIPIAYIQHKVCKNYNGLSQYVEADRMVVHAKQRAVPIIKLQYLLSHPVREMSVQYNDNRIARFVAQYGRCAVTGDVLDMDDVHCHHKLPKAFFGGDEYENLVIVSKDIHVLIHATVRETIDFYLQKTKIDKAGLKKLNQFRKIMDLDLIR
jgi:group II intron reverse transcriptase/maturase